MASASIKTQLTKFKSDGTASVRFRLIYQRESRYYKTSLIVNKKDVTPNGKVKNHQLQAKIDELLLSYRKRINDLELDINDMGIDAIYNKVFIAAKNDVYDFISWAEAWCAKNKDVPSVNAVYRPALNSFKAYKGEKVLTYDMTTRTMKGFEQFLSHTKRAISLYPGIIKHLFNLMCDEYNDYDYDNIVIRNTMKSYTPPQQNIAEKRSLTLDEVTRVFACAYNNKRNKGYTSHHDLALDCFRLSFCLMGMNSVDMLTATDYGEGEIHYFRQKTRGRRTDKAEMVVAVPVQIKHLFERYYNKDARGKWQRDMKRWRENGCKGKAPQCPTVFTFSDRFGDYRAFTRALNLGLKEVGEELGIEHLTYYAARHTFATLAVNEAGISPYLINDMLNHVDPALKITNLYIKKDFAPINEANRMFLSWFFGE